MQDLSKKSVTPDSKPETLERGNTVDQASTQRLELIRRFQVEAMGRPNPLSANLGVINGDLMAMAFQLKLAIEKASVKGDSVSFRQIAHQTEAYLKCVRQIDRFAQIDRVLNKDAEPESPAE